MVLKLSKKEIIVDFNCVSYRRDDREILKNISWRILSGERWVILGENGSGKTSLLNIICGYIWPSEGKIRVLGKEFGETDLRKLREEIGFISPDLMQRVPVTDSLYSIVLSGKFASFGLYDRPNDSDLEYADKIIYFIDVWRSRNLEFYKLSRGEQQKCLIGRALMANPSLLLLDEPYQGLDLPSRERMLNLIDKLSTGRKDVTLILATHHLEEVPPSFTHALLLKDGRIKRCGEITEVINSQNISEVFSYPLQVKKLENRFFAFSER